MAVTNETVNILGTEMDKWTNGTEQSQNTYASLN
jgi:hypothetical protein